MKNEGYGFQFCNGILKPIINFSNITTKDLIGLSYQINLFRKNIESFLKNGPFLDVLLWGERGCGKSSLVKAFVNEYKDMHLNVVQFTTSQIDKLYDLYEILMSKLNKYFIIFFDDISFDEKDEEYRKFKSILEGGLEEKPVNIMFVATSNKRHLVKDKVLTTDSIYDTDEINEQMSLYGRFGLVLGFRKPSRDVYLKIVRLYSSKYGLNDYTDLDKEAEAFAISKGARNGRVAKQFVISKLVGTL